MTASRNVLGPLTTVFTPNPTCTIPMITYRGGSTGIGYQGQSCMSVQATGYSIVDQSKCWPTWTDGAFTYSTPQALGGWGFYSPGISCPAGLTTACSATAGGTNNHPFQFPLTAGETAVGCCPTSYTCHPQDGQRCLNVVTSANDAVVVCSGTTNALTNLVVPTIISSTPVYTYSYFAPLIQLNWQATDRPASATSPPSTSGMTTVSSSGTITATSTSTIQTQSAASDGAAAPDPGLSVGAKAGIGVGVAIVVILVFGVLVWLFRKKQSDKRAALPAELGNPNPNTIPAMYESPKTTDTQHLQAGWNGYSTAHQSELSSETPPSELDGSSRQRAYRVY